MKKRGADKAKPAARQTVFKLPMTAISTAAVRDDNLSLGALGLLVLLLSLDPGQQIDLGVLPYARPDLSPADVEAFVLELTSAGYIDASGSVHDRGAA